MRPPPERLRELRALHRKANQVAESRADLVSHPEVERAIESALVLAMVRCLEEGFELPAPRHYRHLAIIRQFREWLEQHGDRPAFLQEVCQALGVSARTLRACCHEHLGMGPIRYLWMRRMYLARRALRQAPPRSANVTSVATSLGFWELGRFSVAYRTLFGEHPSDTLAR